MASRDVVLRRWEHSTGRSGASGACGTVVRNLYLTYLTTKQPCFHSFPCRVAPKRPLVYSHSVSRDNRRRVRYERRRHSRGAEEAAGGFSCFSTIWRSRISVNFRFRLLQPPFCQNPCTRTRARRRQRAYIVLRSSYPRSRLYFLDLYLKDLTSV